MNELSSWQLIKDYFNSKYVGYIFTRSNLKLYANLKNVNHSTLDMGRTQLTAAKFLRSAGRGRYELLQKIPIDLTVAECVMLIKSDTLGYLESRYKRKIRNSLKSR